MAANEKTLDEVIKTIKDAKLNEKELHPLSQCLWMAEDFGREDIKLIEVDEALLEKLEQEETFAIRGEPSDFAVLCTEDETYEIKEAETSNSLLLLPSLLLPEETKETDNGERQLVRKEVKHITHTYLELRRCKPRFKRLKEMLEENPFNGPEYEANNENSKYTLDDFLDNVQSSENQLKKALIDMQACEINGYWRLLDFDYLFRAVTHILNLMEENSWPCTALPRQEIVDVLEELVPKEVLLKCLELFAEETEKGIYSLKKKEICRLHAEFLLRSAGQFNLEDFLKAWKMTLPDVLGFEPSLDQLTGLALVDIKTIPKISYFPTCNLPEDVMERFKFLFKMKEKWTLEEIEPYISEFTTDNMDINALLSKYARSSLINGIRHFNSK